LTATPLVLSTALWAKCDARHKKRKVWDNKFYSATFSSGINFNSETDSNSQEVLYDTSYDSSCHYFVLSNVSLHVPWQWL